MSAIDKFCRILKNRSNENELSFNLLFDNRMYGNCISILRQELDSLIRVIYLLNISNAETRESLIEKTLKGEKWFLINENGKRKNITDRDMIEITNGLHGWTQNVYKFGCSFIHLSNFHDYQTEDPFNSISDQDKDEIIKHMNDYHFVRLNRNSSLNDIIPYLPHVFKKIKSNFECEIESLTKNEQLI